MALGSKGARRIVVDGVTYRWRVRRKPTYDQGLCWSPATYAVERADSRGRVLVVTTGQPHAGNWLGVPAVPILPAHVADGIRLALQRGWIPGEPGSPFLLDLPGELPASCPPP